MSEVTNGYNWAPGLAQGDHTRKPEILDAFNAIRRINFLPDNVKEHEAKDEPLSIGHGQTNSQPRTVALMLDWLDLQEGQKVLDVGAGSGLTTALIAHIVGSQGEVHGTERLAKLVKMARSNLEHYDYPQASVHHTPRQIGLKDMAPYDRILVSAFTPEQWLGMLTTQLSSDGGILVAPVAKQDGTGGLPGFDKTLTAIRRNDDTVTVLREKGGYAFVPLVRRVPSPVRVVADSMRSIVRSIK